MVENRKQENGYRLHKHTNVCKIRNVHRMKEKKNNKKEREINGNSKSQYLGAFIYTYFPVI